MVKKAKDQPIHYLQKWRIKLGHTQDEAAGLIGWSQSRLSRIENFDIVLTWGDLLKASQGYGISPIALANIDPDKESSYVSAIMDRLPAASEDARKKVTEYVEMVLEKEDRGK